MANARYINDAHILLVDFITGSVLADIPDITSMSAQDSIDQPGRIEVTIPLATFGQLPILQPWRHSLVWCTGGWPQVGGPITAWDRDNDTVTLHATAARAWLSRVEVQVSETLAGGETMAVTRIPRTRRNPTPKVIYNPRGQARVQIKTTTPRSAAMFLIRRMAGWSSVPPISGPYSADEPGPGSWQWDGVDHVIVADAIDDVLAGAEWIVAPYFSDEDTVSYTFTVGDPLVVRGDESAPLPLTREQVVSASWDASAMATHSSAVARSSDGYAISKTVRGSGSVLLMTKLSLQREDMTGTQVAAAAAAGLSSDPIAKATVKVPIDHTHYLMTGGLFTPEWPDSMLPSTQMRCVSWTSDGSTVTLNLEA